MMESEYFFIVVSMSDILQWDESETRCEPNPYLFQALKHLKVELDLLALHDEYFDKVLVGRGDVYLYKEHSEAESFIAFDLYKEPTDQLDLISIAVRCNNENLSNVRVNIRAFFDTCATKVCLEESNISARVLDKVDKSNYPRVFEVSKFRQKLYTHLVRD